MNLEGLLPDCMLGITGPLTLEQEADLKQYYEYVRRGQMSVKSGMRVKIVQLPPAYEANPLLLQVKVGDVALVLSDPTDIGLVEMQMEVLKDQVPNTCWWPQLFLEEVKDKGAK